MHSFRVDKSHGRWVCYVTYGWQNTLDPNFREAAFGPFNSEKKANEWGSSYIDEITPEKFK